MKNFWQGIADFLEALSRKIEPNGSDSTLKDMDRKALIIALEQHRREISELQQSRHDLGKQIIEYIDDLGEINQGDLSKRLDVYACFIGTFGEAINLLVKDLSEAVQSLPATHPLHKKYLLQGHDGDVPPEKVI